MCGIFCEICHPGKSVVLQDEKTLQRVRNRGPDCVQEAQVTVNDTTCIHFMGSVLWMQGPEWTPQPVESDAGVFLYNGDIFDETWDNSVSDTQLIMKKLNRIELITDPEIHEQGVIKELKSLKGPFSLIYYDKASHRLYFARDRIGRCSLLFHRNNESIVISSILGRKYKCAEISATFIHILDLDTLVMKLHPWSGDKVDEYDIQSWWRSLQEKQILPDEEFEYDNMEHQLFDHDSEDKLVQYIETIALETKCKLTVMRELLKNVRINETCKKVIQLLEKSVKMRLETQPNRCKDCLYKNGTTKCCHCTVGILFSGGLDCTILAFLADKYVPRDQPIDLINVAFKKDAGSSYDVPDRLTGKQSLDELKKLCINRKWVFREVNIPKEELKETQKSTIADLVYPRRTILDESLGTALWFSARGRDEESTSTCRVLLLGSGADELFGGYSRHRNAYKYHGWAGLHKELSLDWKRISFRNLARDNRVICDHGRQPRMPYLDDDLTDYVLSLKPWLRSVPNESLGPGVGEKLMLRLVAFKLGLVEVVTFPKRALQFGSRIANKKEKGSDISRNFLME